MIDKIKFMRRRDKKYKNKLKSPSIYIHAVVAMLIIQLIHKIVREIPGSFDLGGAGAIITPVFACMLVLGILLTLSRFQLGLIMGIICGVWMIFQPVIVHIIMGKPDMNGIWWYPIFPWVQAILIIYFSILVLRNEKKLNSNQKSMPWVAFKIMTLISER